MSVSGGRTRALLLVIALVALLIAAQAVAFQSSPAKAKSPTQLLGRTGFAYLGGLRTFAAAVIWNRIDPQFHEYFNGVPLTQQAFMVPKMRMVTLLDPSFIDGYYVTSYIVYRRVGPAEGVEVAREGLQANPDSGTLRANLAQLLYVQDKDRNRLETVRYAKATVRPDSVWRGPEEQFEGYVTAMQILRDAGEANLAASVESRLEELRSAGADAGDHDHDGDGKQDH